MYTVRMPYTYVHDDLLSIIDVKVTDHVIYDEGINFIFTIFLVSVVGVSSAARLRGGGAATVVEKSTFTPTVFGAIP